MDQIYYNRPNPEKVILNSEIPESSWIPPSLPVFAIYASIGFLTIKNSQNGLLKAVGWTSHLLALVCLLKYIKKGYMTASDGKSI